MANDNGLNTFINTHALIGKRVRVQLVVLREDSPFAVTGTLREVHGDSLVLDREEYGPLLIFTRAIATLAPVQSDNDEVRSIRFPY